jgi:uncharacterized membrane protein YuzA (DUF378 family)
MRYLLNIIFLAVASIVTLSVVSLASAQALPLAPTVLADSQSRADACSGLAQLAGNGGTACAKPGAKDSPGQDAIDGIASTVVNIISLIAGLAAVILVIVAGVKFITSGGESSAVASAKNTLVYALIGLAVVGLSQLLVHFVLNAILTGDVNSTTK